MKKKLCILLIIFFTANHIYAQTIDSLLALYDAKVPQEKIHLHFDNSLYLPGQTIWFKAYLTKGNVPSDISSNLYVDWFDEQGNLLNRNISPVAGFSTFGNFMVPENYKGRRLQVLAYTKWMLNFDSSFLFHETLNIAQSAKAQNKQDGTGSVTTLHFFPEGGDLVENISSKIAFKALDAAGMPVDISGVINDRTGKSITPFGSMHDGMGNFFFMPLPGNTYTAEWKDAEGKMHSTPLPQAKTSGITCTMRVNNKLRLVTIQRQPVLEDRFKTVTVVGTKNQHVIFRGVSSHLTDKTQITFPVPADDLSSGIATITVFDNNMQPVAERVIFINNHDYLVPADISTDTVNLAKRGKNVYQVEIHDTVMANLSLSVTNGDAYDSSQNIVTRFLLSSEIKGHVHNPAYYFSSEEDSVADNLDLVMLTNGWRRFSWENVLSGKTPALLYKRDTGYVPLAGIIEGSTGTKIKKDETVNLVLTTKDSLKQYLFVPLQPDGSFREKDRIMFDTIKVLYQLDKRFGAAQIKLINYFLPFDITRTIAAIPDFLSNGTDNARNNYLLAQQQDLAFLQQGTTLAEVQVKTKLKTRIEQLEEKYVSGMFATLNAKQFNMVDAPLGTTIGYNNIFDYLQTRVPGLKIPGPGDDSPPTLGYTIGPTMLPVPLAVNLFINEFPVNSSNLASLTMDNIAYVKVISPPFLGSIQSGAYSIAVYTKHGDEGDVKDIAGMKKVFLPGFTTIKEFYSPNYAETQLNAKTDLRRTIYWNPNIFYDGSHKITLSFYNNDISHTLQLVLEGMAQDGRLIRVNKLLQ